MRNYQLLFIFFFIFIYSETVTAAKKIGYITEKEGRVEIFTGPSAKVPKKKKMYHSKRKGGAGKWVKYKKFYYYVQNAKLFSPIYQYDIVRTFKNSKAKLLTVDKNEITVGNNTHFNFQKYSLKKRGTISLWASIVYGKIRATISKSNQKKKKEVQLKTGNAIMGVRGTDFFVYYRPVKKRTAITAITGKVAIKKSEKSKKEVVISTGYSTNIQSRKKPEPVKKEEKKAGPEVVKKKRILEIYLNIIEFGRNIYGIRAAAEYYFRKSPSMLNVKEGAFLAMLLPSPYKYAVSFREKRLTPYAQSIIKSIFKKMVYLKMMNENQYKFYMLLPLSFEEPAPAPPTSVTNNAN